MVFQADTIRSEISNYCSNCFDKLTIRYPLETFSSKNHNQLLKIKKIEDRKTLFACLTSFL